MSVSTVDNSNFVCCREWDPQDITEDDGGRNGSEEIQCYTRHAEEREDSLHETTETAGAGYTRAKQGAG